MKTFGLVIKNARVVRPNRTSVDNLDIAVKDGQIARLAPEIRPEESKEIFDARNLLAFPGCVDAHMHVGIYAPLAQDASETMTLPELSVSAQADRAVASGAYTATASGCGSRRSRPTGRGWELSRR